ncbi:MAG: SRPBCC family protein [Candidatus Zixiibacteriota bacterium]
MRREQIIARPIEEAFSFFERPENLEKITPSSVGFVILTPGPIPMHPGAVLDYTIRPMGFPIRWTTLITSYDPPHRFTDVALKGPYSYWHHTHTFEKTTQGTIMRDEVRYALPLGWIGRLVRRFWVRRQLDYIFDFRAKAIEAIFRSSSSREAGADTADKKVKAS